MRNLHWLSRCSILITSPVRLNIFFSLVTVVQDWCAPPILQNIQSTLDKLVHINHYLADNDNTPLTVYIFKAVNVVRSIYETASSVPSLLKLTLASTFLLRPDVGFPIVTVLRKDAHLEDYVRVSHGGQEKRVW